MTTSGWSSSYCSSNLLHVCKERRNDRVKRSSEYSSSSEESKVVNFIESCMTNMAASVLRSVVSLYGRGRSSSSNDETMHKRPLATAAAKLTAHDDDSRPLQIETNGLIIKTKLIF